MDENARFLRNLDVTISEREAAKEAADARDDPKESKKLAAEILILKRTRAQAARERISIEQGGGFTRAEHYARAEHYVERRKSKSK